MRRTTAESFVLLAAAAVLLGGTLLSWGSWLAPGSTTHSAEPVNSVLALFQAVLLVAAIGGAFASRPPTPPATAVVTDLRYGIAA